MNDKDARDMHRLAVGAGKAPTDAQIIETWDKWPRQGITSRSTAIEFARAVLALTTPPPAPSSPAPVAESAGYMASPMCPRCGAHPKGITHACIPSNAAAPSTVDESWFANPAAPSPESGS